MDKSLFSGDDGIAAGEMHKLEVRNGEEAVDNSLKAFGWNGKNAVGCVLLHLSADNRTATGGQFAARGRLAREEVKLEAAKVWKDAEAGPVLTVRVPGGGEFTFGEGGLCSDYMDSDKIDHCVTTAARGGQPVLQDDFAAKGIGGFCLRLVCHISKAAKKTGVTLGYTVLIFPGTAEEVQDVSDLTKSPSWPGMRVAEGEMALLPHPAAPWGCPVLPLLRTSVVAGDEPAWPTAEELRARISWIMATSEPAEVCKTKKALLGRWQKYAENPDEFVAKKGPLSWPKPSQSRQTGRQIVLILAIYTAHCPL
jgi:hypothetical protein